MIADHQKRSAAASQILPSFDPRPAQQNHGRPHQNVMRQPSHPSHRPPQYPLRIVILRARPHLAAQHPLHIAHRARRAEASLAQIHLITILQRADQFHAIERTQTQLRIECRVSIQPSDASPRDPPNQLDHGTVIRTRNLLLPSLQNLSRREFTDQIPPRLLRIRARKVFPQPLHPHPHALKFRQRLVRPLHHPRNRGIVAHNHHRTRFRISSPLNPHHHTIFHFRLPPQRGFQILRINIQAARRHDHFFLAPLEIKIPGLIQRAHISGAVPPVFIRNPIRHPTHNSLTLPSIPIPCRHAAPANQNLAIIRQLHIPPRQHLPNRSFPQLERMIHADQRSSLRQPITLDSGVSQPSPEFFSLRIQRRASANECPEPPAKLPVNPAKNPPPPQKVLSLRSAEPPQKVLDLATILQIAFNPLFQRLQNSRHTHQHRHALPPDRIHNLRRLHLFLKDHGPAQQRRQKHPQELPKYMAQRQQIQKPHRMHPPLILQIPLHLVLQRSNVSQHIPMRNHHTLGFSGSPRSKHNLQHIFATDHHVRSYRCRRLTGRLR